MIKREHLIAHSEQLLASMLEYLRAYSTKHDPENLHQLRVEIKRYFALSSLLDLSTDGVVISGLLKPIKKLFRSAGEIRNVGMTIKMISRCAGRKSRISESLKKRMTAMADNLCADEKLIADNLRKTHERLVGKFTDIDNKDIEMLFEQRLQDISVLMCRSGEPGMMHESRKLIKKLLYISSIAGSSIQSRVRFDREYYHKLEDSIGRWHDVVVAIDILLNSGFTEQKVILYLLDRCRKLYSRI